MRGAFHGRTSLAVTVTDNPKIQAPVNKSDKISFVALNDVEALEQELAKKEYAAVIIEPIQGVNGIQVATDEFLQAVRKACDATGTLLICDEVQAGCGRSGKYFSHQYSGIKADVITVAKGIANGFPMGGVLIAPHIEAKYGMLGTTFGGNHLACAAAIAVLEVIESEKLVENARQVGDYLIAELKKIPQIVEVRGRGLMIGIDIAGSASEMRKRLLFERHIFTGGAGATTVRLLPALTLTKAQADTFLANFKEILCNG
jgi:acetylornithine aminotransferase